MTTEQAIAGTGTVGITSVLQSAQSPDATLRGQAEQHLQQLRENNHVQFVASLTEELCEESKPVDTRRLAGLILKNELDARDEARKVSPPPHALRAPTVPGGDAPKGAPRPRTARRPRAVPYSLLGLVVVVVVVARAGWQV